MATPSHAFPYSPTPQSPSTQLPDEPISPTTPDDRRKRPSTRTDDPQSRYPSPPAQAYPTSSTSGHRSRPSYDPSLIIPPFNPNKRRSTGNSSASTPASAAPSRRNSQSQNYDTKHSLPSPPLQTHAHAHAHRPVSVSAIPAVPVIPPFHAVAQQQQQQHPFPSAPLQQAQHQQYFPSPVVAQGQGASVSSRSRQSVGYLPTGASLAGQGPYPHLYNPHPMPRQKIYFGPYILLQTLGEGEFGKVKLGVHGERWGEDVAIKLIKRGNVDTAQRGEKVRREIEVLKMVRHPNIVRLYDVIETEKYIGIVLEYASGGELFDHILAHRYLKERDASRLFAQLISGVSYLHRKGVVHRDLKLENLLLDRNRNVIITDFGFANRFNDAKKDLMATSCGSPCYAAPELVVQDGRYIGTAVDVWSCGVILYAMLAGYLPYDDDPANPEGDNINLLYKYILNTPLVFPEWITDEPRELLLCMLVADPDQRYTIEEVTRHSWLRKYASAFDKTVEELEYQAQEMEMAKRQALEIQRQWLVQQQQAQQLAAQGFAPAMSRSQTSTSNMGTSVGAPSSSAARHRSAMVTSSTATTPLAQQGFDQYTIAPPTPTSPATVLEEAMVSPRSRTSSTASRPMVVADRSSSAKRRSGAYVSSSPPTTQAQFVKVEADPFSFETRPSPASTAMTPSLSAPAASSSTPPRDSVMLDAGSAPTRTRRTSTRVPPPAPSSGASNVENAASAAEWRKKAHRATVQVEYDGGAVPSTRRRPTASREPSSDIPEDFVPVLAPIATPIETVPVTVVKEEATAPEPSLPVQSEVEVKDNVTVPASSDVVDVSTIPDSAPAEDVVMEDAPQEQQTESVVVAPGQLKASEMRYPHTTELTICCTTVAHVADSPETITPTVAETSRPATPPLVPFPAPATTIPTDSDVAETPRKRKSSRSPAQSFAPSEASNLPPLPALLASEPAVVNTEVKSNTGGTSTPTAAAPNQPPIARKDSNASTVQRPRTGLPSDRFSIRSFLGGSTTSVDKTSAAGESSKDAVLDEVTNRRKANRRQKAMSLQPFRNSTSSKVPKQVKANIDNQIAASREEATRYRSSTLSPGGPMLPPPVPAASTSPAWVRPNGSRSASGQSKRRSADLEANWSGSQAGATPSGKAKAVMDWFRRRGTKGYERDLAPISTDFDRRGPSSVASIQEEPEKKAFLPQVSPKSPSPVAAGVESSAPAVVVTSAPAPFPESNASAPSSRSASGAQSDCSVVSASTAATTVSTSGNSTIQPKPAAVLTQVRPPVIVAPQTPVSTQGPAFAASRLRFHQGALDKNAVTYRSPDEVILELKTALWNMGVDMAMEGDYKIKCLRKSRKKALANNAMRPSLASGSAHSTSSSIAPAAASALDRRTGLPSSPSLPQSPSMGFRSLFNRSKYASGGVSPSLSSSGATFASPGSPDLDPLSSPMTTSVSQFSMLSLSNTPALGAGAPAVIAQPLPVYGGEKSADAGDEVRFVVELTRVKNLDRLYCVDIKRMRGGPWSYKHVYEQLLSSLELGPVV
ncbi:uncharacterized protein JCM15063_002493 [Sporobolomyces koalae]|uniref:uncharacterized protein n=1 Tax=Sporobolomyces koalae TaxID=500713 RepID=UPI003171E89C